MLRTRNFLHKPALLAKTAQTNQLFSGINALGTAHHGVQNVFQNDCQQRNSTISEMGRTKVNMSKSTKIIDDLLHPHPDSLAKKFTVGRKFVRPQGETKAMQTEKNKTLNPKGVVKPQKISPRNMELLKAIYECGRTHKPELAFEAYRRLSFVPDVKAFNALIKSCEKSADHLGAAFQIYQDMKKVNTPVNLTTFSTLLGCCAIANHWQRAMYVLKELLKRGLPKEPKHTHLRFFQSLLQLLHKNGLNDRILFVYDTMREHNVFNGMKQKLDPVTCNHKTIPMEFVQLIVPGNKQAKLLQEELLRTRFPNKQHHEEPELGGVDGSLYYTIHPYAYRLRNLLSQQERSSSRNALDVKTATLAERVLSFNVTYADKGIEKRMRELYDGYLQQMIPLHRDNCFGKKDDEPFDFMKNEQMNGVKGSVAREALSEAYLEFNVKAWKAQSVEEVKQLYDEYLEFKARTKDRLVTKLPWKPVVIGTDGTPFFPTTITIQAITGDTVAAAKREYLQSIEDEALRKEAEEQLETRVRLCWYNTESGKLIQGLFY